MYREGIKTACQLFTFIRSITMIDTSTQQSTPSTQPPSLDSYIGALIDKYTQYANDAVTIPSVLNEAQRTRQEIERYTQFVEELGNIATLAAAFYFEGQAAAFQQIANKATAHYERAKTYSKIEIEAAE